MSVDNNNGDLSLAENLWGYGKRLRFIQKAIREVYPNRDSETIEILDVGCGNGSQMALPLLRRGFRITGVDMHGPSIEKARRLSEGLSGAEFIRGTLETIPAAKRFDVVLLSEVLEHVENPQELLGAAVKNVRATGLVIVTTPNGYGEFELDSSVSRMIHLEGLIALAKRAIAGRNNRVKGNGQGLSIDAEEAVASTENHTCGHLQFFTLGRLNRIFKECNLSVVSSAGSSFLSGPIVCLTFGRSRRFVEWNARVTDSMPLWLASGWFFALSPDSARRTEEQCRDRIEASQHAVRR